ncbi:MAG: class I SAM-dependent methyltransferase [bacterium]
MPEPRKKPVSKSDDTSWQGVANWYDELLEDGVGTYQKDIILPNILKMLGSQKGLKLLDLGCGQGFFSREFLKAGANVTGVDLASKLIDIAKERSPKEINFLVSSADALGAIKNNSFDIVVTILAIQNMKNVEKVMSEASRVLKAGGSFFIVMNHPAFRNPKKSSWDFDEKQNIQFRRVDEYFSSSSANINMHPGDEEKNITTVSFHHSLQFYFKALSKAGFMVAHLEEWISHKESQPGPRAKAENKARREFPLFLALKAKKTL